MFESKFIRKQQQFDVMCFGKGKDGKRHMLGRLLTCTSLSDLKNTIDVLTKQPFIEGRITEFHIVVIDELPEGDEDEFYGTMPEGDPITGTYMPEK